MLKVFLVEDEYIVREGIKKNVDWESNGYEFCGEATDGEVAFPMIQKLKPDIVITDIKMPFMDGLTLSKLIKKEMPWIEIIILTGHETFDYAKEALKIGVAEYLSKPISGDELLKEVGLLAAKIEEKQKERALREKYKLEMEENIFKDRRDLFQYLVTGSKALPELLEIAENLKINLSSIWYNIALFEIKPIDATLDEQLKQMENSQKALIFESSFAGRAFLFKADSYEELQEIQNEYFENIKMLLDEQEKIKYFGGVGTPVNRLSDLKVSSEAASRALSHRYFVEGNHIMNCDDSMMKVGTDKTFKLSDINTKQIDRTRIKEFLKMGAKQEIQYFVEDFFMDLGKGAMDSNIFRQYITMDAYFAVVDFVEGIQMTKDEIESFDITSNILKSTESVKEYIIRIISQAVELRDKSANNKYGDVVEEITKYIENNYRNEELSLNSVAEYVNFSPNHLSMIFSQQTGQTFIKYLTDFRMNKAKELLRCTGKKSSIIAQEIGYKDPHYFSYVFKKTQNMTPTQYREGNLGKGEE